MPLTRCVLSQDRNFTGQVPAPKAGASKEAIVEIVSLQSASLFRFQGTFSRVMSPLQIVIITVAIALLFVPLTRCISIVIRDFTEQSPVPTQAPF